MKEISLDINELRKEYALSCVENYVMALISQKYSEWEVIYSESFLSVSEILRRLDDRGFSYFKGVPRLQAMAEDYGFINMQWVEDASVFDPDNKEYYAFMINDEYMKAKYNAQLWRPDHFILAHNDDDRIEYLNDIPPDHGFLSKEECVENYNNGSIVFGFGEYKSDREKLLSTCRDNADKIEKALNEPDQYQFDNDIEKLRDAVCVEKVLVKRQGDFPRLMGEEFDSSQYYNYLNGLNAKIEYIRLRKKKLDTLGDMVKDLIESDKVYYKKIVEVLRRVAKND